MADDEKEQTREEEKTEAKEEPEEDEATKQKAIARNRRTLWLGIGIITLVAGIYEYAEAAVATPQSNATFLAVICILLAVFFMIDGW